MHPAKVLPSNPRNPFPGELTAKQAAFLAGVSPSSIYRYWHDGRIEGRQVSRFCVWFAQASILSLPSAAAANASAN